MKNNIKSKMSFEEWAEKYKDEIKLTGYLEKDLEEYLQDMTLNHCRLLPRLKNNMYYCFVQLDSYRRGIYSLSIKGILNNYTYTMYSVYISGLCKGSLKIEQGYITVGKLEGVTNDKYKN